MFSLFTRFWAKRQLQTLLQRPIVFSFHTFNEPTVNANNINSNFLQLFSDRNRYKIFQKSTNNVYEFDDETRNIVLWQSPKLSQSSNTWDQPPVDSYSNDELICAFENLLNYSTSNGIPLHDRRFNEFIDNFIQRLETFSLNQMLRALQYFFRYPMNRDSIRQPNYIELLQAFDQACAIKSQDLLPEQLLFISTMWINVPFARKTYSAQLIGRLFNRYMRTFNAPQMTQALFFTNAMAQDIEDVRALENVLERNINDLTIEELSSVLWTFGRLDTKIEKQELKQKFFAYLEKQDLDRLCDRHLATVLINISKIYTTKADLTKWENIAKTLRSTLANRSLKTCILMANVGISIRLFDNDVIANVFNRCLNYPDEFDELSMPDLEYLSRVLSTVNHSDKDELQKVGHLLLNEIVNRLDQVASRGFYAHFTNIIRNLTVIDVYNLELMDNIFRPDYIRFIHKNSKQLDLPLYEIDGYNRINLKNIYTGNRLSDIHLAKLCFLINWVPDKAKLKYKKHYEFTFAIEDVVRKLFTYCQYAHAVAHRKNANLIACIDRDTLKPVDISKKFPPLYQGKSIEANTLTNNDSNLIVFAFIASNIKEYSFDNRNKCIPIPLGYMAQKVEQLKLLGYQPIMVPCHLWKEARRQQAIEQFIIDALNRELHAMGIEKEFPNNNQ